MRYDDLSRRLWQAYLEYDQHNTIDISELLYEAAEAIKELQNTVVIVEVKENKDGVSNT